MLRRFFSSTPIPGAGSEIVLASTEAHHLLHVLRAQVGDAVTVFDGTGVEYEAKVTTVGKREACLTTMECHSPNRELAFDLELAVALPRGDRQDWLIQKATEVGVTRLVPWQVERSVAKVSSKTLSRLRRGVIEASKQCRRNRLMEICEPIEFAAYASTGDVSCSLLAHLDERSKPLHQRLAALWESHATPNHIRIGVGPEGGFTDGEARLACDHGWRLTGLGRTQLRTETAAIVMSSHLALWQD